jgi:hypothetical protein
VLDEWRPQVEQQVSQLQGAVRDLRAYLKIPEAEAPETPFKSGDPAGSAVASPPLPAAPAKYVPPRGRANFSPDGRYDETSTRGPKPGVVTTVTPPAKGTGPDPLHVPEYSSPYDFDIATPYSRVHSIGLGDNAPNRPTLPVFDGDNPKWWKKSCEKYFKLFHTDPDTWKDYATMYFTGQAKMWLQSVESKIENMGWEEFCSFVCLRFGKLQYQVLIRRLTHVRQTGTVQEYIESFNNLMHQMLAHNPTIDDEIFITTFIDGLKPEIRRVVIIQQPVDLDTAGSLALLQEEVMEDIPVYSHRKHEGLVPFKSTSSHQPTTTQAEAHGKNGNLNPGSANTKLSTLKAYRRARGLCFICGEKWGLQHKCSSQVQICVVQELLDMLSCDQAEETEDCTRPDETADQELYSISQQALKGLEGAQTVRLCGQIQNHPVLMLVDSGSSVSFVSQTLAAQLSGGMPLSAPTRVKIANGVILQGSEIFPDCEWQCQGAQFKNTFRSLPLDCYDLILGMDWLQQHSPMQVDWVKKQFIIPVGDKEFTIKGIQANTSDCPAVSAKQLQQMIESEEMAYCLWICLEAEVQTEYCIPEMKHILEQYKQLFEEPKGLPPSRPFDHSIPLLAGAQPVTSRPYRYNPEQKNEIEKQVAEMLKNGVISPSSSPFSSPVLLVGKKDLTWRLCVDYRGLNAITVKNKYPIPVVDELLDELHGARFFTSLDLRSGYHQIRMKQEDEYKTAFRTHNGHYQYKVLPYGLTGAPATF